MLLSFALLILVALAWVMMLAICADSRYPEGKIPALNKELAEKSRLRRILKYIMPLRKDQYNDPYICAKAIPYFIYFIIVICVIVIYVIYAIIPSVMFPILSHPACAWVGVGIAMAVVGYGCAIKFM